MVLKTRWTTANSPGTRAVVMSPTVTSIASPPGLARIRSIMARDMSMPATGTPRAASGSAILPVPTANSSTLPPPASSASRSTTGSTASGRNMAALDSSYRAATFPPK